jgi:6-phosphogluconolactonase
MATKTVLYSAVGSEITRYEVDVKNATLSRRETVKALANVQYAWPHPSRHYLYVATSNRGGKLKANSNHVSAFRIDPETGTLTPHGDAQPQYTRAVHICLDPTGKYLLSGHNLPRAGLTVNPIQPDGTIGPEIKQQDGIDYGIYPHQVMATPSGRAAILIDRGNNAEHDKAEDPGALRFYRLDQGRLSTLATIAPNWGYGFGPRHLDFHPSKPWVYVSLERQNQLYMYRLAGDAIEAVAAYVRETLADPKGIKPRQLAGPIHVSSDGRHVYLANRADWTVDHGGVKAFGGGENNIAVFALDPVTGEPTLIQHADTHSIHVRTFAFDPSGKLMVAASVKPLAVRDSAGVRLVPAALSVFRVGDDGRLDFVCRLEVQVPANGELHYWMGIIGLPGN